MALAFDAVYPGSTGASVSNSGTFTLSWNHTCTGSNLLLVAGVTVGSGGVATTTSATYNSVSMTSTGRSFSNNGVDGFCEMFYLVAPATGTNSVDITLNAGNILDVAGGSLSFTGVDQSTPVSDITPTFGSSGPATMNMSSAAGKMVVDLVCTGSGITSSGQTQRWLKNINTSSAAGNGAQSTADGASSVTMSYTITNDWWGMIALNVNPAPVAINIPVAWLTA
jgi:hypothetical protein